jgi:hypothetical protein
MQAFHNDPAIKQLYIDRLIRHAQADELVQGTGWKHGKGCAVGCTLEAYQHSLYPTELGILEEFAHLEDRIFEGLPNDQAMTFPLEFLQAFPVGMTEASQRMVLWRFKAWLLTPVVDGGLAVVAEGYPDVIAAVERVRRLIDREIAGDVVSRDEWAEARAAAARAARAAEAWAAAARSARAALSRTVLGKSEAWTRCREKLIELILSGGFPTSQDIIEIDEVS